MVEPTPLLAVIVPAYDVDNGGKEAVGVGVGVGVGVVVGTGVRVGVGPCRADTTQLPSRAARMIALITARVTQSLVRFFCCELTSNSNCSSLCWDPSCLSLS